jgi:hypothetical protein
METGEKGALPAWVPTLRIGPIEVDFVCSARQLSILRSIESYYTEPVVAELLVPFLDPAGSGGLSLRAMDWLVTNFAKRHSVICRTRTGQMFNVHQGYKSQLALNKRRHFDPFRRRMRVRIAYGTGSVESTIGQLNFMHWARENGVVEYLRGNILQVVAEMNETTRRSRAQRTDKRRKRAELTSAPPAARCMVYGFETRVRFRAPIPIETG